MSTTWLVVLLVGAFTIAFKAAGPVLLGGRELPARMTAAFELLAPSLLAALVVTQAVGGKQAIVLDGRLVGVGTAIVAVRLRAPLIVAIVAAAVVTALDGRYLADAAGAGHDCCQVRWRHSIGAAHHKQDSAVFKALLIFLG
jgi:branched-subunit amino acid transport protein